MIKLCYKEYDFKLTSGAKKYFHDKTGLDLATVFSDYIVAFINKREGAGAFEQMQCFAKLHSRKTASLALYSIIKECNPSVSIEEIYDATCRVDWVLSDRPDDLSEPWPFVMLNTALDINDYCNKNAPKKKEVTRDI